MRLKFEFGQVIEREAWMVASKGSAELSIRSVTPKETRASITFSRGGQLELETSREVKEAWLHEMGEREFSKKRD